MDFVSPDKRYSVADFKKDSKEAIKSLKQHGVKEVVMLTGDNEKIADKIAKELGIDKVYSNLLQQVKQ